MFDMQFVSELLQNILLALLVPLASAAAAYLVELFKEQRAKVKAEYLDVFDTIIRAVVVSAEQAFKGAGGEEKKAYAIDLAEKQLAKYGFSIDLEEIEAAIEGAVFNEFNRWTD